MNDSDPLPSFAHYDRVRGEPFGLTVLELVVAGLPTALFLGQLYTAEEATLLGAECLVLFILTALIRHGCGWSLWPTALACLIAFAPALIWVYQAAIGTPPDLGAPGEDV